MKIKHIIVLLCAITFYSCISPYTGYETVFMRSAINGYMDFDLQFGVREENSLYIFDGKVGLFIPDCKAIYAYFPTNTGSYDYRKSKIYTYRHNTEKYDELCRKHNDMTYNRKIYQSQINYGYWASDLASIEIISDADFDVEHSAGTSLNDIVIYGALSSMRFIKNGYSYDTDYPNKVVRKLVSELEPEDMQILYQSYDAMGGMIALNLPAPTLAKTHNITVTLTTDDGRVFEDTLKVSWE